MLKRFLILGCIAIVGALMLLCWFVPNPSWSSKALVATLSRDTPLQFFAKEVLLRRNNDPQIVIPALVNIAGSCLYSSEDIYWHQSRIAAESLCRWRAPASISLLQDTLRKRLTEPCGSARNPGAPIHVINALGCLAPMSESALGSLKEALGSDNEAIRDSAAKALRQIGTLEAMQVLQDNEKSSRGTR